MKKITITILSIIILIILYLFFVGKYEILLGILIALTPLFDMAILIGIGLLFYYIGKKIGDDKARKEIEKELKQLNINNPYIYFRDIPNKHGVGVTLSLLNIKITKEDVLASILDLCAKGYINFKQDGKNFEIINNKKDRHGLLKNELYILDWVLNKDISKINLKRWKKLCDEDAINLGLAIKNEAKPYKSLFKMDIKYARNLLFVSFGFSFILIRLFDYFVERSISILETLFLAVFLTGPIWFIVFLIMLFVALLYEGNILNYNKKMNNLLILTEIGKKEYHEICSLGKFLDDFGRFAEKHVGEIMIWEQYLSYAIVFRLGNKILKTGYDKLKINDNFIIDDIDKIVF